MSRDDTKKTEFLFIRHAQSTANATSDPDLALHLDPVLTMQGQQQAQALAEELKHRNVGAVYYSNTTRARLTAHPIAKMAGVAAYEIPQIDEWNIGAEAQVDALEMHAMFERWCAGQRDRNLVGAPNSETLRDLMGRVVPAFQTIFDRHKNDGGVVAIVAHGGSISWTMPAFAQNLSLRYALENSLGNACSLAVVEVSGAPYVTRWDQDLFAGVEPAEH